MKYNLSNMDMKKYDINTVIQAIDCQIEKFKSEAMRVVDEEGLEIAQKIMGSNPGSYYFIEEFKNISHLITSLKIEQLISVLDIKKDKSVVEQIVKYTQLTFVKNEILRLEKMNKSQDTELSILMQKYSSINDLIPVTDQRYFFEPVYFCIHYKDEEEETIYKICPETYSYHIRQEECEQQ